MHSAQYIVAFHFEGLMCWTNIFDNFVVEQIANQLINNNIMINNQKLHVRSYNALCGSCILGNMLLLKLLICLLVNNTNFGNMKCPLY